MFDIIPLATSRGHFFFSISLSAPAFGLLKNRWSKLTAVWKAPVQYETNSLSLKVWESLPIKFNTQTSLISDSSYALMIGVCPSLPLYPLPPNETTQDKMFWVSGTVESTFCIHYTTVHSKMHIQQSPLIQRR